MSKRDVTLFVQDMLQAIAKVERYTAGMSWEGFEKNEIVIDAVTRNLEVIGEAAKQIPDDLRNRYGAVDWKRVAGFRDIAIHHYFAVDVQIVWTIATQRLAELKAVLDQMVADSATRPGECPTEQI